MGLSLFGRYYVDTRGHPPRSTWDHPLGPPSSPQQSPNYAPPPNPPLNRYNSGSPSFPSQFGGGPPQYNQTTPYPTGYQGSQDQRNFSGVPPQPYPPGPQSYGYPGGQGWSQGSGWPQSQQPPPQGTLLIRARDVEIQTLWYSLGYFQQQPSRNGRQGMGTAGTALLGAYCFVVFEHVTGLTFWLQRAVEVYWLVP